MTGSSFFSRACWVRLRPNWSSTSEPDGAVLAPASCRRRTVWPAFSRGAAGALVAGEELDDLLAHAGEVGAELHEHLGGHALALADEAEEDVLGADVVVAELERLAERELEDLLGPRRERDVPGRRRAALADDLLDLAAHGLERDAERLEGLGGDAFALVDQPEQDVLGADVVVVEEPSFLLGQHDDPSGSVGEPFEQVSLPPLSGGSVGRVYPWPPRITPRVEHRRVRGPSVSRDPLFSAPDGQPLAFALWSSESPLHQLPGMAGYRARVEDALPAGRGRRGRADGPDGRPPHHGRREAGPARCSRWPRPPPWRPTPAAVDAAVTDDVILGGVSVELVQVGSLCHDDVIDEAETRRGVDSVNARWGNLKAILAGDFLLAKASEIAAGLGTEVAGLLAATIGRLCEGEVNELRHAYDPARTIESYLAAIEGKTAALFATACRVGGIVGDLPRDRHRPAHRLRAALRHGVPDRRRRARRHRHRRAARQARRPRHRRGHLQPPGAPRPRGARRRPRHAARRPDRRRRPRHRPPPRPRRATGVDRSIDLARRYIDDAVDALAPLDGTPVGRRAGRRAPPTSSSASRRSSRRAWPPLFGAPGFAHPGAAWLLRLAAARSVRWRMPAGREDALVRGLLTGIAAFRWLAWAWMAIVLRRLPRRARRRPAVAGGGARRRRARGHGGRRRPRAHRP